MSKPGDKRPTPSRRDVANIAKPGSLIIVYDDLVALIITWSYRVMDGDTGWAGSPPRPQHLCELLLFDPKNRKHFTKTNGDRDRIHALSWLTIANWLFDRNNDLVSEVIDASDPER